MIEFKTDIYYFIFDLMPSHDILGYNFEKAGEE